MIRQIEVDLTPEEWRELEIEAGLCSLSLTDWIRELLRGQAAAPDRQEERA